MRKIKTLFMMFLLVAGLFQLIPSVGSIGQHETADGLTEGMFKLGLIDSISDASTQALDFYVNGTQVYTTHGQSDGLRVYSFDGTTLTHIDDIYDGGYYRGVWGDGMYIYVACQSHGLRAYRLDDDNNLILIDTFPFLSHYDVWGDGTYIYTACTTSGISAFTFDGTSFTSIDTDVLFGGYYYRTVWGDGTYIYVACESHSGIYSPAILAYSFNGVSFTFLDADYQSGADYYDICGNGTYIYASDSSVGRILAYSFDGSTLSLEGQISVSSILELDTVNDIIYASAWGNDFKAYSFDGSSFTLLETRDDFELPTKVHCNDNYIFVAFYSPSDGFSIYSPIEYFPVTRTILPTIERNSVNYLLSYYHNGTFGSVFKVPISDNITGIVDVTNNIYAIQATEVNASNELINNTFWYDSTNQFVHICTLNLSISDTINWTINCSSSVYFNLILPVYLEVGQYFHAEGFISDNYGNAISGMIATTRLLYENGTDALPVNPKCNCTGGNYRCTFSTSILIPSTYSISVEFIDPITGIIYKEGETLYLSSTGGGYYASEVVFNFYNTNEGLGLPYETLQIYVEGERLRGNTYSSYSGGTIEVEIKDYYNTTLFHDNLSIDSNPEFVDLGLTFHSYKFSNLNAEYYMISFLKTGGSRWYERAICPYETVEYLLPSGTYSLRIYDADNTTLYLNSSVNITNSRAYVINGSALSLVISGVSVIVGQLLEGQGDFVDIITNATMPDIVNMVLDPPSAYCLFSQEGSILGTKLVCPALFWEAKTTNETNMTTGTLTSYPLIPTSGYTNGTITVKKDVVYFSGSSSVSFVNLSYGSTYLNYSYIPNQIDLNGQTVTITTDGNITVKRIITYTALRKFYWTKYTDTNFYTATIGISNPLSAIINEVYVIVEFANDTVPDYTTVRNYDVTNGVYLTRGQNFVTSADGVHFYLAGIAGNSTRRFTISYYGTTQADISSSAIVNVNAYDLKMLNDKNYYHLTAQWVNTDSSNFLGTLFIKFNFSVYPYEIAPHSFAVFDHENSRFLNQNEFTFLGSGVIVEQDAIGTVYPNSARTFDVYFLFIEEEADSMLSSKGFLHTKIAFIWEGFYFEVIHLIGFLIIFAGIVLPGKMYLDKKPYKREVMKDLWVVPISSVVLFLMIIVYFKGF